MTVGMTESKMVLRIKKKKLKMETTDRNGQFFSSFNFMPLFTFY